MGADTTPKTWGCDVTLRALRNIGEKVVGESNA